MRQRSYYPKPFKAQFVWEYLQPAATVCSVSISHGINANVIRKWIPLYREQFAATSLPACVGTDSRRTISLCQRGRAKASRPLSRSSVLSSCQLRHGAFPRRAQAV